MNYQWKSVTGREGIKPAVKKNEIIMFTRKQAQLEIIMLSKISQIRKTKEVI